MCTAAGWPSRQPGESPPRVSPRQGALNNASENQRFRGAAIEPETSGELPDSDRGYRCVRAEYEEGAPEADRAWRLNRERLIPTLTDYLARQGQSLDAGQVATLADLDLLHAIAGLLPFHPAEKQALLEAPTLAEQEEVLAQILELGMERQPETGPAVAPN